MTAASSATSSLLGFRCSVAGGVQGEGQPQPVLQVLGATGARALRSPCSGGAVGRAAEPQAALTFPCTQQQMLHFDVAPDISKSPKVPHC